jgi:hypothetical protein
MAKIKTHRAKHGKLWISVYLQDFGFGWNLGLNIYKSRRAQNDWYNCKRNRRARRAAQTHGLADFRCLAACARLMRRVLDQHEGHVFVYPSEGSREILLLYLIISPFLEWQASAPL